MKKILLATLPILTLTACQAPMTWDEQLAIYQRKCQDFGFPPGTPEFADCIQKQDAQAVEVAQRQADRQNQWKIAQRRQQSENFRQSRRLHHNKKH